MSNFSELLERFARAVEANDGAGVAALFTPDGSYDDYFWGVHSRDQIPAMIQRFHDGGKNYQWEFLEPLSDGKIGYARYIFSYEAMVPEAAGEPVVWDGYGQFQLEGDRIKLYREVFDRGLAFAQLKFVPEKLSKLMNRYAAAQAGLPEVKKHLDRVNAARSNPK